MTDNTQQKIREYKKLFTPVDKNIFKQEKNTRPTISVFRNGLHQLVKKHKLALVCIAFVLLLFFISMFLPFFYKYSCIDTVEEIYLSPFSYSKSGFHIFGTDTSGHDYFIRVIYGIRVSLLISVSIGFIVSIIGIIYGSISGIKGDKTDLIMMRITDIINSLPEVVVAILFSTIINEFYPISDYASIIPLVIVFMLFYWINIAQQVRSQIISIKQQNFIIAVKGMGAKNGFIIRKHLIPNCIGIIAVSVTHLIPNIIFSESYLSLFGIGVKEPYNSLGTLVSEHKAIYILQTHPHLLMIPSILICLIVLSFYIFGNALQDSFDPKQNKGI